MMQSSRTNGVSLVEILMAMMIFSLFIIPLIHKFTHVYKQSLDAKSWVAATAMASSLLEEIKTSDFPASFTDIIEKQHGGTRFYLEPSVELDSTPKGFTGARPSQKCWKIKVSVRWNLPGEQASGHQIQLFSAIFRNNAS